MLTHHAREHLLPRRGTIRQGHRIIRFVQHRAGVITHTAVHRNVAAHANVTVLVLNAHVLDGAHRVQGRARGTRNRATRLEGHVRNRHAQALAGCCDGSGNRLGHLGNGAGVIRLGVADAVATTQVQLRQGHAQVTVEAVHELQGGSSRLLEALRLKNLRTNMAVNTAEIQGIGRVQNRGSQSRVRIGRLNTPVLQLLFIQTSKRGGAGLQGHAELLILVRGRNGFVGRGMHAGGDANQHRNRGVRLLALSHTLGGKLGVHALNELELVHRVSHHTTQAVADRAGNLSFRLVITVQGDIRTGHLRTQSQRQLTTGGGIQAQPLLGRPARHGSGQERLTGVVDAHLRAVRGESLFKSGAVGAGAGTEGRLGEDVLRGFVLSNQVADGHAINAELALLIAGEGISPDGAGQGFGVLGVGEPFGGVEGAGFAHRVSFLAIFAGIRSTPSPAVPGRGLKREYYMRSGALTPSRFRPLASTCCAALFSSRRVRCRSVTSSSALGATRETPYQLWYAEASCSR